MLKLESTNIYIYILILILRFDSSIHGVYLYLFDRFFVFKPHPKPGGSLALALGPPFWVDAAVYADRFDLLFDPVEAMENAPVHFFVSSDMQRYLYCLYAPGALFKGLDEGSCSFAD